MKTEDFFTRRKLSNVFCEYTHTHTIFGSISRKREDVLKTELLKNSMPNLKNGQAVFLTVISTVETLGLNDGLRQTEKRLGTKLWDCGWKWTHNEGKQLLDCTAYMIYE